MFQFTITADRKQDYVRLIASAAPEGVRVSPVHNEELGFGESLSVAVSVASGVASGVITNWIWEVLSARRGTIRIEISGKGVTVNRDAILAALENANLPSDKREEI